MRIFHSIYLFLKALKKTKDSVKYSGTLDGSDETIEKGSEVLVFTSCRSQRGGA